MLYLCLFSVVTLCPSSTWSPSYRMLSFPSWSHMGFTQAACLPALQLHTIEPILQEQFQHCPNKLSSQPSCPAMGHSPRAAALPTLLLRGCPWAVDSVRPLPLLHCGHLHSCTWRSAPHSAWGLKEDSLLLRGLLLGCRKLLLHAWSICRMWPLDRSDPDPRNYQINGVLPKSY